MKKILGALFLTTLSWVPCEGHAAPVSYSGTASVVLNDGAFGPPPVLVGDAFQAIVDLDLASPPQGTVFPLPPGFSGSAVNYQVAGTVSATLSGHSIAGATTGYLVLNDLLGPNGGSPVDQVQITFNIGDCNSPAAVLLIGAVDFSGTKLSSADFAPLEVEDGWLGRFNIFAMDKDPVTGACLPTLRSIVNGSLDSMTVSIQDLVNDLITSVVSLNLQQGISNSLDAKLETALHALDDVNERNDVAAVNSLAAFVNAVEAQRGQKLSEGDACALIRAADALIVALGGQSSGSSCLVP